jgi:three-Cys-motif partner protein
MIRKFPRREYIDLFAGPGRCVLSDDSGEFEGSPIAVLKTKVPFSRYHFVEAGQEEMSALKARARRSDRFDNVSWYHEDANLAAEKIRRSIPKEALALALIDNRSSFQVRLVKDTDG